MAKQAFLIFGLQGQLLALEAMAVREIIWLLEITPLEETPPYITGVINLRGHLIPVMDLNRRFGHAPQRYQLTDSIIVVALKGVQVGLIVNEAKEVITISPEDIEASPATGLNGALPPQFATRVAKVGGKIVTVLNHVNLLQDESLREKVVLEEVPESTAAGNYFCPEASPEEQAIFRDRARRLMEAPVDEGFAGLIPTAVVGLNGEYFGVDLELVRRFADLRDIVPIPCCPGHIVGNMNLRGNILTLVDVRTLLDLPGAAVNQDSKVMVASLGDLAAGVVVDQVFDIIYLNPADIGPVPTAIQKAGEKYLKGTTPYGGKVMAILNLSNLLASENLLVAEEV